MRIGIDVDNVLFPFTVVFNNYIERRMGLKSGTLPGWSHWNHHQKSFGLTHEQFAELYRDAVIDEELFLQVLGIQKEASDALWELNVQGHTVVIVTDRNVPGAEREARAQTFEWLRYVPHDEVHITSDKLEANCDIYLDDRPGAIPTFLLAGKVACYWDQPWNSWFPYDRVKSWPEFVDYVGRLNA